MKFSILIIAILALAFSAYSQTTNVSGGVSGLAPTNALQAIGVSPAGQNAITALENVFVDVGPYITNDVANIQAGLLYNKGIPRGKIGGFLDASVPVTQQSAIGFGGAYIGNQWFDATVNLKLGTTFQYPLVGKVYNFVASGPDWAFHSKYGLQTGVGAYNFAGVEKTWDLSKKWNLTVGFAVGDISQLPGLTYAGGAQLNFKY